MKTHFILNNRDVTTEASPGRLVLDYLRRNEGLCGTKEGCKEGDCGACAVLIGELRDERVVYKPVTSCLVPLGELQGKHLVTIEGLNLPGRLNPVQKGIVAEGATQCGFCTPGIVVSMMGFLMQEDVRIDAAGVKRALGGHLCRCTGYRSLKASEAHLRKSVGEKTGVAALLRQGFLPDYFKNIPVRLKKLQREWPSMSGDGNGKIVPDFRVAGGTDIYVQRGADIPDGRVDALNLHPELNGISREKGHLRVGALTTFEEFASHPAVQKMLPEIEAYMHLIASWQIRNRATLGGNIINASPIADMTISLLSLGSRIVLKSGKKSRTLALKDFYKGYKQMDKKPGEILAEIWIPLFADKTFFNFEKVSKRTTLDIATVNSALKISVGNGNIQQADLAVGGVAPVPLFMRETSAFLTGKPLDSETVQTAIDITQQEISPISDIRGSADYKRLLTRQLLIAHFCKLFPERVTIREFYEKII